MFEEVPLVGAFRIEPERITDDRGYFSRVFCAEEYRRHGMNGDVSQSSVSYNVHAGTLRGIHYQASPHGECKLVRCVRGSLWDVLVDVRPESPTYGHWWATELDAVDGVMLYMPEGVAHGFLTLEPHTEVLYQMSHPYVAESARGLRWDDPGLGIDWRSRPQVISERDRTYPDFPW